ncbi:MAG: pyruvate dehydrogenase (acetyl-transferring), homodimeric type, partial [Verrucomicrobiota bacterium]|nr:pyruvate dehydrogenase (acetyl-transferring), homodimeric type [Verrucomicrobiota bacterium]
MIDIDSVETREWLDAIDSVIKAEGVERAQFLLEQVIDEALANGVDLPTGIHTQYSNTIPLSEEHAYPGDITIERRIRSIIRWNAIMIVLRASQKDLELGGHMASYQSAAAFYEVGFNHFFRAPNEHDKGDLIYYQGHISPGIYARAFVEDRLTEKQLDNFRQEVQGNGLSSYPHPKLMPNFWQFPTVSMGLAPISAIYQARFLRYLENNGLRDTSRQRVYAFLGDGEMDEPESRGALAFASRERLNNLCFLINCNLQRLDGPVMGNGKIIQELEG